MGPGWRDPETTRARKGESGPRGRSPWIQRTMRLNRLFGRGRSFPPGDGRPRAVWGSALTVVAMMVVGCQLGEAPAPEPPAPAPEPVAMEGPALEEGVPDMDPARAREAAELLARGEAFLAAGEAEAALDRAEEVAARFARVPGTVGALWLEARARAALEAWVAAEEAADAYLARGAPPSEEAAAVRLLLARVRLEGRLPGGIESLFDIPADAPSAVLDEAETLALSTADGLPLPVLRDLVDEAPRHPRIHPVFHVELATRTALLGDEGAARRMAESALELDPGERVAERARAVLRGELETVEAELVSMAALLPEGGPPSLRSLAAEIRAGVEVALSEAEATGRPVRFTVLDDQASRARVESLVRQLEEQGAVGLVGPLDDALVEAAARVRSRPLPIISPTARLLPEGVENVFSLTGVDPGSAETLARLALDAGIREVVVVHPRRSESLAESQNFRRAFEAGGGVIRRVLMYAPGTTDFAEPFREVVRLRPQGLVLLLPPEEIELVAPQVAFFGVDDLEITILGNDAWSSEAVLEGVPVRHTNGVLTVTSRDGPGSYGPGWRDFVDSYETHFRRTLRSPLPALGYDAANLFLAAVQSGDGTPEGTARALEAIRGYPGATGRLSVVDGRIRRTWTPVRIENREPVPYRP